MKKMGVLTDYMDGEVYLDSARQNEENAKALADLIGWNKQAPRARSTMYYTRRPCFPLRVMFPIV